MSRQRDPYRAAAPKARTVPLPERRLALSGLIRHTLLTVADREQQRGRLLSVLILALALLTLAIAPAYLTPNVEVLPLAAIGFGLVVYIAALLANRAFHRPSTAAYLLVFGGILAVIAQAVVLALTADPVQVGQSTLLFLALILVTGLLFAPEVTLITAGTTTTFTAFVILLALSLAPTLDKHEAYLLVIFTIGLQALAGLIAWLLAQFIFETTLEAQRGQEMQFAQARLEALSSQVAEQQERLDEQIGIIQATITRALAGEYHVRTEIPQGELAPLAESLSLLLERVQAVTQAEQMQSRMQAAALPLIDAISRMGDASTPTPSSLPIITNTPFDSVSAVVSQMQASVAHRLARVQQLVGDIVGALGHSREGLSNASEAVQEAQRIAGALIATTERMLAATHRQIALLARLRRTLTVVLPEDVTRDSSGGGLRRGVASVEPGSSLTGLGPDLGIGTPGYTSEFAVVGESEGDDAVSGIVPMTVPLPVVELLGDEASTQSASGHAAELAPPTRVAAAAAGGEESGGRSYPPELAEVWALTQQLDAESAQLERAVGHLARELGVQSRHMRTADASVAWFQQAMEAVRENAEQLQQLAGPPLPPPPPGEAAPSRPLSTEPQAAAPSAQFSQPSRPSQPSEPQSYEPPAEDSTLAQLASLAEAFPPRDEEPSGPATGSLRAMDLLMLDDDPLPFSFDPPQDDGERDQEDV